MFKGEPKRLFFKQVSACCVNSLLVPPYCGKPLSDNLPLDPAYMPPLTSLKHKDSTVLVALHFGYAQARLSFREKKQTFNLT